MIAVTGAGGFIGSNLAHRLAAAGQDLVLVDRGLSAAKAVNLAGLPRFTYLGHEEFIDALETGEVRPSVIFHLGACSRTTETSWDFLLANNVQYTQRLWAWCAHSNVPLYYASSAATYGDGGQGFSDETLPVNLQPLNLYGKSKNDFDIWAFEEAAAGRPSPPGWAGVKFFNVYGPRESHKGRMASVVWQVYGQIQTEGVARLFKSIDPHLPDGGQRRDFVFVEDCIDHLIWLWRNPATNGIYNSGTGAARTFLDLAKAVFAALNRPCRIEFVPTPADIAKQYQNFTQAEMGKLGAAGFDRAATSLEAGIARTVASYSVRAAA